MSKAAKARRKRLFKSSRPKIRPARQEDANWFLMDYCMQSPDPIDMTNNDEMRAIRAELVEGYGGYDSVLIVEDKHPRFESGFGPVGVIVESRDGWTVQPHTHWFAWCRNGNKLRGIVRYLWEQRWSPETGVAVIHAETKTADFFKKIRRYVPVFQAGRIPAGVATGEDAHLFYVRGKQAPEARDV